MTLFHIENEHTQKKTTLPTLISKCKIYVHTNKMSSQVSFIDMYTSDDLRVCCKIPMLLQNEKYHFVYCKNITSSKSNFNVHRALYGVCRSRNVGNLPHTFKTRR